MFNSLLQVGHLQLRALPHHFAAFVRDVYDVEEQALAK
jgi:hypothetical protein